jgi:hypothetical protein
MVSRLPPKSQAAPLRAGASYFALVFALGFVLGTLRTLVVADAPGGSRLLGVLIELPIVLTASWFLCRYVIRRFGVASAFGPRALMGGLAFALLLLAELMVGTWLFGRSVGEHVALYRDPSYALGLAAQLGFALMPLAQLRLNQTRCM